MLLPTGELIAQHFSDTRTSNVDETGDTHGEYVDIPAGVLPVGQYNVVICTDDNNKVAEGPGEAR